MTGRADHVRGALMAFGGMALISPDGLMIRLVSPEQGGTATNWDIMVWRGLFAFVGLAIFIQLRRPGGFPRAVRTSGWAGVLTAALIAGGTICFVTSMTETAVANTLVLFATVPLMGAVFAWIALRERLALRTWGAMAAALAGILVIFGGSLGSPTLFGDGLALAAAACMGGALVMVRRRPEVDMLPALAISGLIVPCVAVWMANPLAIALRDFAIIALMGLMLQAAAIGLFLSGARYLPAGEVGLFALVETVLGPLWVWLVIGEVPTTSAFIGGGIVLSALAVHSALAQRRAGRAVQVGR